MKLYKQIFLLLLVVMIIPTIYVAGQNKNNVEFYQIKVYHCKSNEQLSLTEQFLKADCLPALHQLKFTKIGIFKPIENDTAADKRIYVFIPSLSIEKFISLDEKIAAQTNVAAYADAAHNNPPYQRVETIILKAFKNHPHFIAPSLTGTTQDKVYELRSYEGATEKLYRKKVHMFNEGNEIGIFTRLNFNAVFYAEVLAGCRMPNLMYMTGFNSMKERDEHWKTFGSDAEWKRLSSLPEYQNTVSKADIILMHATEYSDF